MNKDAFSGFHPVVNFIFFLVALGLTMFIQQPVHILPLNAERIMPVMAVSLLFSNLAEA